MLDSLPPEYRLTPAKPALRCIQRWPAFTTASGLGLAPLRPASCSDSGNLE